MGVDGEGREGGGELRDGVWAGEEVHTVKLIQP